MSSPKFEEFLRKVTSKVKSKEAHSMIKKELTNHLEELSKTYQEREHDKEAAEDKAIQEMGNPYLIGENLSRIHKPKMDWLLITLFITIAGISFLPLIGGVPEWNATSSYFMTRQITWYVFSAIIITALLFFDYRKLKNFWVFSYGIAMFLLLYTYLFGYKINGATRYIIIEGVSFNPLPLSLLLFFLAWTSILFKINEFKSLKKQVLLFVLFWTPVLLYLALPYFAFTIMYFFCVIVMFAFSKVQKKLAMKIVIANMVTAILFISSTIFITRDGYYINRFTTFLDPQSDPDGAGWIYIAVRDALSQGGWFGNGLHNNVTFNHLPEAHTDFAFPYLIHSLGWLFGMFLCFILLLFIWRVSKNAFKTTDLYGRLLVIGGATLFTVPASWNILMGFGMVPIMGVSLPFISYGGSMFLFYSAILGFVLNVYRRKDIVEPTICKTEQH
ncbi:FtsW/RodA/SpoVE family cell cycle protein [Evansella sp. AB-P1]|uniref:FtsW/RodA/SpoVE family cell cycle protein n=1 Tax=Evansella sp. AB-P1 TaxID=3037653 RepID=UPI00241F9969|nr:FtsW/RodA/SpoVE family cell cycle protein [Evansella sp. AB-P1]MDG5788635.1 FtsW/RodA/SpoVE family cell cycle protein [Evansella sp. AB-P1]